MDPHSPIDSLHGRRWLQDNDVYSRLKYFVWIQFEWFDAIWRQWAWVNGVLSGGRRAFGIGTWPVGAGYDWWWLMVITARHQAPATCYNINDDHCHDERTNISQWSFGHPTCIRFLYVLPESGGQYFSHREDVAYAFTHWLRHSQIIDDKRQASNSYVGYSFMLIKCCGNFQPNRHYLHHCIGYLSSCSVHCNSLVYGYQLFCRVQFYVEQTNHLKIPCQLKICQP